MHREWYQQRVGLGAIAILLISCGATSSVPLSVEPLALEEMPAETMKVERTFFIPGETMSFDLTLRGVLGGTAVVAVGEPGYVDEHNVVIVRSRVASAGVVAAIKEVHDEIVSWIRLDSGRVVRHEAESTFGNKQASIKSSLGAGKAGPFTLDYQRKERPQLKIYQRLPVGAFALDVHGALGVLRAWDSEEGDEESFFLLSGRRLWRNTMRVGAHETIRTAMGRQPAIRIDGVGQRVDRALHDVKAKKPRHYSIWLSDDASRIPLLVMATTEYGDLRAELVDYSRPDRRLGTR